MVEWNVSFICPKRGKLYYLGVWVDSYSTAKHYLKVFSDKYVGKPYPNGKGVYPFTDPKVEYRTTRRVKP